MPPPGPPGPASLRFLPSAAAGAVSAVDTAEQHADQHSFLLLLQLTSEELRQSQAADGSATPAANNIKQAPSSMLRLPAPAST